jgi:osmotically-inducible protein OsmY
MKGTELIQRNVLDELAWDPEVDSTTIAVTVADDGIVRLSGDVGSFGEKLAAEKAAQRIMGVKALVDDLTVRLTPGLLLPDEQIARAAIDALRLNVAVPRGTVTITVEDGWITLAGQVPWFYQRRAAEKAVRYLHGVKGVMNLVAVEVKPSKSNIKRRIEGAFKRSARIDSAQVTVEVQDGTVTLEGVVASWPERTQAENAAWSARGVRAVKNQLSIAVPVGAES